MLQYDREGQGSALQSHPNLPQTIDLAVIGGGAAGFFAAVTCAESLAQKKVPPRRIVILDKATCPLGKVLVSGGGRCNLTHACFDTEQLTQNYPRGGAALRGAFSRFQPRDTIAWFEGRGVALKIEPDGRVFPVTDAAQTVVDCLLEAATAAGVEFRWRTGVTAIQKTGNPLSPFLLRMQGAKHDEGKVPGSEVTYARCVLLATGGEASSLKLAAGLGQPIIPPVPSLFTFTVPDTRLEGLAGISLPTVSLCLLGEEGNRLKQPGLEQQGPVLITHWGLSGPAVLRLSAWGARWLHEHNYRAALEVNWLGDQGYEQALDFLQAYKRYPGNTPQKAVAGDPFNLLPLRLWKRLAQAAGVGEEQNWGDLSKSTLRSLAEELSRGQYRISGREPFKEEFVTCGGVSLDEVDFKTMESKLTRRLYFAGEVLDVDGLTGGFNLQNAWTTGWLAGTAITAALGKESKKGRAV